MADLPHSDTTIPADEKLPKKSFFGVALEPEVVKVSGYALLVGLIGGLVAQGLLELIYLFTNIFFYGRLSFAITSPAHNHLGLWVILIPPHWRVGGRFYGPLLGTDAEGSWHSRSDGSCPFWAKPNASSRCVSEAAGHCVRHWHRRTLRGGRSHHSNRRGLRVAVRAGHRSLAVLPASFAGCRSCGGDGSHVHRPACGNFGRSGASAV